MMAAPRLRGAQVQPAQTVSPGQWIRVPLPSDRWPLQMQIGRGTPQNAFLERDASGNVYAQVRCPALMAGSYPVKVFTPDTVIETSIQVQ
jgi:hypothetical protein